MSAPTQTLSPTVDPIYTVTTNEQMLITWLNVVQSFPKNERATANQIFALFGHLSADAVRTMLRLLAVFEATLEEAEQRNENNETN